MSNYLTTVRKEPAFAAALSVTIVGAATILGFLFFEHALGYPPCPLCLDQRMAFYVSVPLAVLLWLGVTHGASPKILTLGFLAIAGIMLWNTGLSVYHAGIEWKFWPGPNECGGSADSFGSASDMLSRLQNIRIVRCDEAAWRFLGLSLAGYDALVSLFLAGIAAWGAKASYSERTQEARNDS